MVTGCAEHTMQYTVDLGGRLGGVFANVFWPLMYHDMAIENAFAIADPEVQALQDPQMSDLFNPWTAPEGWLYP